MRDELKKLKTQQLQAEDAAVNACVKEIAGKIYEDCKSRAKEGELRISFSQRATKGGDDYYSNNIIYTNLDHTKVRFALANYFKEIVGCHGPDGITLRW